MNVSPSTLVEYHFRGELGDDELVAGVVGQRVFEASLEIDVDKHGGAGGDCLHRAVKLRGRGSLSLALLEEAVDIVEFRPGLECDEEELAFSVVGVA